MRNKQRLARLIGSAAICLAVATVLRTSASAATAGDGPANTQRPGSTTVTADQPNGSYNVEVQARVDGDGTAAAPAKSGGGADPCPGCKWAIFPACSLNSPCLLYTSDAADE